MSDTDGAHGRQAGEQPVAGPAAPSARAVRVASGWLGGTRLGLVVMALAVGAGAGLGAVGFRYLIFGVTWIVTGYQQYGQQGHVPSLHLPWLGLAFLVIVPVLGGLLYGPLIQRFAREARGHGVPEVMLAVAENGGRIRPPVTIVKALASAMCIGTGGSVGREGPIVQIGSAFASTLGQMVRMSETRLRIMVACGAAGGIAATFNAPITGLFFGFEIVLREFSLDALFGTILSSVTADIVSRAFFGSGPFFAHVPHGLTVAHDYSYLLIAVLGLGAGLLGVGFKTSLYGLEDTADRLWRGRAEWARPAVGGIALGVVLLALPQLYGVGYPVMDKVIGDHELIWFMLLLMAGKVLATGITLSIGGSGGVFAPSLFMGAMGGMAYGVICQDIFGASIGPPAMYAVVAMGGVFAAAAQAPLTSIATVVEMTGNIGLTLAVMLASGISAALSRRMTYGSIYTTKLLRRGIDIERPQPTNVLQAFTVADVMQRLPKSGVAASLSDRAGHAAAHAPVPREQWERTIGPVIDVRRPQALFADETLQQALRQLVLYGRSGLPVLSHERDLDVRGWITRENVLRALQERVSSSDEEIERGALAARLATQGAEPDVHAPSRPLGGYEIVELTVTPGSPVLGKRVGEIPLPAGCLVMGVTEGREIVAPRADIELRLGSRVVLLAPGASASSEQHEHVHRPER